MILRRFVLAHQEARNRAAAYMAEAPEGVEVVVKEPARNSAINAALHAKLTEIATSREWAGRKWDVETWKRLLTAAYLRAIKEPMVMLPALDGQGVDIVFRRTSSMTQREVSELLAFIEAWESDA
jgi:NinB protein